MLETFGLTEYLALMFGVYLVAAGIGLLLEGDAYNDILEEFYDNQALGYISRVIVFALGVVVVRLHNDWSTMLAGFVSFVGWAMLVEGILLLSVRRQFIGLFINIDFSGMLMRSFGIGIVLLGGVLVGSLII